MTADVERVNKRIFSDAGCIWTRGNPTLESRHVEESQCDAGKGYRFHLSHPFLPNQDDVVYLHRVSTQLLDLNQPIYLRETSVDPGLASSCRSWRAGLALSR